MVLLETQPSESVTIRQQPSIILRMAYLKSPKVKEMQLKSNIMQLQKFLDTDLRLAICSFCLQEPVNVNKI